MIPREEHLKQVNRFHDMLKDIGDEIEKLGNDVTPELLIKYFFCKTLLFYY